MTSSTALWYTSRATGVVALLLLTAGFALGITVNRQARLPGLPRFAVTGLHRNIALLAISFTAVHVLSAVLDTYVHIPLLAGLIPFTSSYESMWMTLGAVAFDLMLAMTITSLIRGRLNPVAWRVVHLTAYLSWPIAFLHSLGSSKDLMHRPMALVAVGCAAVLIMAVAWRIAAAATRIPRARRVAAMLTKAASAR